MALTPLRTFVDATSGRTFAVRVLPAGARITAWRGTVHARSGIHSAAVLSAPVIEFYDTTSASDGDTGFGPLGQFVADYYPSALRSTGGLALYGNDPVWIVSDVTMDAIRSWLGTLEL